jgi:transposase
MWIVENRARYNWSKLRYPSDLTDEEWALAKTEIPRAKRGGQQADCECARCDERPDVCAEHWLSVARDSEGPAAAQHGGSLT